MNFQMPCANFLWWRKKPHSHISTDATYSLPREAIEKNHLRMITHMERWSDLMYFFPEHLLLLLKQSLSFVKLLVRSRLSSHQYTLPLELAHARAANARLGDHLHNQQTKAPLLQEPSKLPYLHGRWHIWCNVPNALTTCAYVASTKQPFCTRTNSVLEGQKHPVISGKTHLRNQQLLLWRLSVDDLRRSTQRLLKISLRTKPHPLNILDSIGLLVFWAILNSQLASSKRCHFLEAINRFSFS